MSRHAVVELTNDSGISFGRSQENALRIGHAPRLDRLVPRMAGEVSVSRERLLITNMGSQLSLLAVMPGRASVPIPPGESYGPAVPELELLIEGEYRHSLRIVVSRPRPRTATASTTLRTNRLVPRLTERQRSMLDLYVEPLRNGGTTPLSHQQVAERLCVSRALVRLEMTSVWDAFTQAGVPMRQHTDKRDEVVDAWLRHRLTGGDELSPDACPEAE